MIDPDHAEIEAALEEVRSGQLTDTFASGEEFQAAHRLEKPLGIKAGAQPLTDLVNAPTDLDEDTFTQK